MTVYSIHEEAIWAALHELTQDLAGRADVVAVVLFGSLAQGRLGVGSDVDLLVILSDSNLSFLERIARYRPDRFPVDIDIFPYTLAEITKGQPLAQEALTYGRILWQRAALDLLLHQAPTGKTIT